MTDLNYLNTFCLMVYVINDLILKGAINLFGESLTYKETI